MKVEQATYKLGVQRLFYVATNSPPKVNSVTAIVYTAQRGRKEVEFRYLEFEIYDLWFTFYDKGKYIFIIFEDGLRVVTLIVTTV